MNILSLSYHWAEKQTRRVWLDEQFKHPNLSRTASALYPFSISAGLLLWIRVCVWIIRSADRSAMVCVAGSFFQSIRRTIHTNSCCSGSGIGCPLSTRRVCHALHGVLYSYTTKSDRRRSAPRGMQHTYRRQQRRLVC